jgi:hypothetical protein
VECHFIWLCEKVHRSPEHPKAVRLLVAFEVFLGIPFLKKKKPIFILDALIELATMASLLLPYRADQ